MDKIDCMEKMGLPVTRWAGLRIWNAIDYLNMLRLRKWKQNVRDHDRRKHRYRLKKCVRCGKKQHLNRHHQWSKLKPHDRRSGLVDVVCPKCHRKAEAV